MEWMIPIKQILGRKDAADGNPFPAGMEGTRFYDDPPTPALWNLLGNWNRLTDERQVWRDFLFRSIRARVIIPAVGINGICDSPLLQRYIAQCHSVIVGIAETEASTISKRRWLHYGRRLPTNAFSSNFAAPAPPRPDAYRMSILEALTAAYGATSDSHDDESGMFTVKAKDGPTICRLIECTILLSHLQESYRWSGRGARYRLGANDVIPTMVHDPAFQASIDDYRSRMEGHHGFRGILGQMGTVGVETPTKVDSTMFGTTIFGVELIDEHGWNLIKDLTYTPKPNEWITTYARFSLAARSYRHLASLFSEEPQIAERLERSIAVTVAFLAAVSPSILGDQDNLASAISFGFVQVSNDVLEEAFQRRMKDIRETLDAMHLPDSAIQTSADLIREAQAVPPRVWPVRRGAFIRSDTRRSVLDLYGANSALGLMFRQATSFSGDSARIRGRHFEDGVQRIIDDSPWKPPEDIRSLRGRTLRINGANVTDIDAIGANGEALLVVSCKARVHDAAIELGQYAPTRNLQTLARESVEHWMRFIDTLRRSPRGDNFNVSRFRKVIGVVCFTFPVFLAERRLSQRLAAPSLRTLCTLEELQLWLSPAAEPHT